MTVSFSMLNVGIPWSIGHATVCAVVTSAGTTSMPISVMALTAIALALPLLYVVCLFIGAGKTPRPFGAFGSRSRCTRAATSSKQARSGALGCAVKSGRLRATHRR